MCLATLQESRTVSEVGKSHKCSSTVQVRKLNYTYSTNIHKEVLHMKATIRALLPHVASSENALGNCTQHGPCP